MDAERRWYIADKGFRCDEYRGAFIDAAREQAPENDAGRDIGQRLGDVLVKQSREYETQGPDENTHRERQPEWAEHRASKPLADIVEGQARPQFVESCAIEEIGEGLRRYRFRRNADDWHFILGKGSRGHAGSQLSNLLL